MYKLRFAIINLFFFNFILSQVINNDKKIMNNGITYELPNNKYFDDSKKANLFIKYNYSDSKSIIDGYSYDIVIVDSLLTVRFNSSNTDSFNYIDYKKIIILDSITIDSLKNIIKTSKIRQYINGMPTSENSAKTTENLFIKYKNIKIAGGFVYSNAVSFSDSVSDEDMARQINYERKLSSSISGNYDLIIEKLKFLFDNLSALIMESNRK